MVSLQSEEHGLWRKDSLATGGIMLEQIKGLFRIETNTREDALDRFDRDTKERYAHDDLFGRYCFISEFIHVPPSFAFSYMANVFSLEEWTIGIRDLKHIGGEMYQGKDRLGGNTEIFVHSHAQKDAHTIDYAFAWDQKEELWVRRYMRLVDATAALNRPGTIVSWFMWKHPYYEKSSHLPQWLKEAQRKTERVWIGDYWRHVHAWHKIEADNLRYILEHRYHNRK